MGFGRIGRDPAHIGAQGLKPRDAAASDRACTNDQYRLGMDGHLEEEPRGRRAHPREESMNFLRPARGLRGAPAS